MALGAWNYFRQEPATVATADLDSLGLIRGLGFRPGLELLLQLCKGGAGLGDVLLALLAIALDLRKRGLDAIKIILLRWEE